MICLARINRSIFRSGQILLLVSFVACLFWTHSSLAGQSIEPRKRRIVAQVKDIIFKPLDQTQENRDSRFPTQNFYRGSSSEFIQLVIFGPKYEGGFLTAEPPVPEGVIAPRYGGWLADQLNVELKRHTMDTFIQIDLDLLDWQLLWKTGIRSCMQVIDRPQDSQLEK